MLQSIELRYLVKGLLLPPFTQIIILLLALWLYNRLPRLSKTMGLLSVISLWLLGTPAISNLLALSLEKDPAVQPMQLLTDKVDAIVILAGWQNETAPEFGEPVSGQEQLSRIRYGAFLHRKTGLPVLLSGGRVQGDEFRSLAETMAFDLYEGFSIKAKWLEDKSRTTAENAQYSYAILGALNKKSIALVTNSQHMMRAKMSFEQVGFTVLPAPTDFIDRRTLSVTSFLPNARSLYLSSMVLHEWMGYWAYRFFVL